MKEKIAFYWQFSSRGLSAWGGRGVCVWSGGGAGVYRQGPSRTAAKQLSLVGRQTWDSWAGTDSLEQALLGSLWHSDRLVLIRGEMPASQGTWSGSSLLCRNHRSFAGAQPAGQAENNHFPLVHLNSFNAPAHESG